MGEDLREEALNGPRSGSVGTHEPNLTRSIARQIAITIDGDVATIEEPVYTPGREY